VHEWMAIANALKQQPFGAVVEEAIVLTLENG
jgi:hypothetical protein